MEEISFEYLNKLAEQTITISSLLGGFSIAVIANLLVSDTNTRLSKAIMVSSTLAACSFLITVFSMTNLLLKTTKGYPTEILESGLLIPRVVGVIFFFLGIMSLLTMISLAGWTKSKGMGRFTTAIGVLTFLALLFLTT